MIRKAGLIVAVGAAVVVLGAIAIHGGVLTRWTGWIVIVAFAGLFGWAISYAVRADGYLSPDDEDTTRYRSVPQPDHVTITQVQERVTERMTRSVSGPAHKLREILPGTVWSGDTPLQIRSAASKSESEN